MALTPNTAQINSAANGNKHDLRETLTSLHLAVIALQSHTGTGSLNKVDSRAPKSVTAPALCGLSVTGANGSFSISITLPQQMSTGTAPGNATNTPIYHELSSSSVANFATGVTTYPVSSNTNFVLPNPGATLYWRLRSSYDQQTWNSYRIQPGAVAAGLQSSAASEPATSLNQTNFATIDSVANGGTATLRIYGPGGVGTSFANIAGQNSKVIPSGTIMNVAYGGNNYVAWDGAQYQVKSSLSQCFPDAWVPVGKVSVISNGAGLVLPTFHAIVSGNAIVAIQIVTPGNGMTSNPIITITDSTGTGAAAVCTESGGSATGVTVTNAGSGYSSSPTVTASGGVAGGVGGGGGPSGNNSGRLFSSGANS